jgi:hypothetical protein
MHVVASSSRVGPIWVPPQNWGNLLVAPKYLHDEVARKSVLAIALNLVTLHAQLVCNLSALDEVFGHWHLVSVHRQVLRNQSPQYASFEELHFSNCLQRGHPILRYLLIEISKGLKQLVQCCKSIAHVGPSSNMSSWGTCATTLRIPSTWQPALHAIIIALVAHPCMYHVYKTVQDCWMHCLLYVCPTTRYFGVVISQYTNVLGYVVYVTDLGGMNIHYMIARNTIWSLATNLIVCDCWH